MSLYNKVSKSIEKVRNAVLPEIKDIEFLLSLENPDEVRLLLNEADQIRKEIAGDGILLRGIIEFSNLCKNTCLYCGLNRANHKLKRYELKSSELLERVERVAGLRIKTVVLQSGEDSSVDAGWFSEIIREIKIKNKIAITLSVGERSFSDYNKWKKAGADRYLLKIETSNEKLYTRLHPGMSFNNRVRCYDYLQELGYQTGSGCLVGLRGQTLSHLAEDMIFFKKKIFDMIGIGVFIPHQDTVFAGEPSGSSELSLKVLALTRILNPYCHLPAATSLGTLGQALRVKAFTSGANVFMPNFTPDNVKELYSIYPGKTSAGCSSKDSLDNIAKEASEIGRTVDYSIGDSLLRKDKESSDVYSTCKQ